MVKCYTIVHWCVNCYTFYTLRLSGTTIVPHRASILVELINTWWCWLLEASSRLNCSNTYKSYVTIILLCGAMDYICYLLHLDTLGPILSVLIIKDSLYDKTPFGTINEYVDYEVCLFSRVLINMFHCICIYPFLFLNNYHTKFMKSFKWWEAKIKNIFWTLAVGNDPFVGTCTDKLPAHISNEKNYL